MMAAPALINFCIEPFVAQVTSTSVAADDHAPSNLAALSSSTRNKGFRVERYVRPPVCVCVRLVVPVTVSCLLFCPDLNTHTTQVRFSVGVCGGGSVEQQVYQGMIQGGTDGKDTVLAVVNPRMWARGGVVRDLLSARVVGGNVGGMLQTAHVQECRMLGGPVLAQCRQIFINITRWSGVRPVSLKWVELWGKLATSCSKSERVLYERGCQVWAESRAADNGPCAPHFFTSDSESTNQPESHNDGNVTGVECDIVRGSAAACTGADSVTTNSPVVGDGSVASSSNSEVKDVPIQLLDEITFEVMELPMVLPSGRCVDASTLDKLAAADAACGRPPTDPFTGLAFSDECGPQFSVHVKGQLDEWQSTCLPTSNRARSVGSGTHIRHHLHRIRRPCSSEEVPSSKKAKISDPQDIAAVFPGGDVSESLVDHTPFTSPSSGRMNSSPRSNHFPETSSLTFSQPAFPDSSPASVCDAKSKRSSTSRVSDIHERTIVSRGASESSHYSPSIAMDGSKDAANKSFDCKVEQSLNHALSNIFDCHSSTFSS